MFVTDCKQKYTSTLMQEVPSINAKSKKLVEQKYRPHSNVH